MGLNQVQQNRFDDLCLLIEPSPSEAEEILALAIKSNGNKSNVALDENDTDPDGETARLRMIASELYNKEKKRNERTNVYAERYYAKRSKELNGYGFRG